MYHSFWDTLYNTNSVIGLNLKQRFSKECYLDLRKGFSKYFFIWVTYRQSQVCKKQIINHMNIDTYNRKHNVTWIFCTMYVSEYMCLVVEQHQNNSTSVFYMVFDFKFVFQAFSQIDELLRRMPIFSAFSRQSLAEFELKWRHWQEQCKQSLADSEFISYPQLETICKVCCIS